MPEVRAQMIPSRIEQASHWMPAPSVDNRVLVGLEVPQALLEQLAIGGRLVAPVGGRSQHLELITRIGKTEWTSHTLEDCHFVPLRPGVV